MFIVTDTCTKATAVGLHAAIVGTNGLPMLAEVEGIFRAEKTDYLSLAEYARIVTSRLNRLLESEMGQEWECPGCGHKTLWFRCDLVELGLPTCPDCSEKMVKGDF